MSFTFIHAADIHLDSPLRGLEKYEGAPVERIRNATRDAFRNLVDLAIDKKVSFLVISGDLYDGDWKDYNTGLYFVSQMSRLQKEGIDVYLIRGNHDAASLITRELKLPSNVVEFSVEQPATETIEELKVAIHGQGFESRSVTENLVKAYPKRKEGYLNIGMLHTSATGREDHENYAPCQIKDLQDKEYDYWALGHIHLREVLQKKDPVILFPGNTQGRHVRESGDKGCTLVRVNNGQIDSYEHHTLDVLRWETFEVDVTDAESTEEVIEQTRTRLEDSYQKNEGRFLAVRIRVQGATNIHQKLIVEKDHVINNLRSMALEVGYGDVWIEKVKIETTRLMNINELKERHTPIATILEYFDTMVEDEDTLAFLLKELKDLQNALPFEVKSGDEGFDFTNTELITQKIDEVEDLLLHHLTRKTGVGSS